MQSRIRVAILDDHQSIIDGYTYRLSTVPDLQIVATAVYGEGLDPMMAEHEVDVLLLDVSVPNSPEDHNPFPILHAIPRLLHRYPSLNILVISMFTQHALIEALIDTGISGYIFKDDQASIEQLAQIVGIVANGGIYFSKGAYQDLRRESSDSILTPRQLEALSLCASLPDGLSLAFLLTFGIGFTPVFTIVSLISSLMTYRFSAPLGPILIGAVILSAVYGIDALLLRRRGRIDPQLQNLRDTLGLILSSVVVVRSPRISSKK